MLKQDTRIVNIARALALVLGTVCASSALADGTENYTGNLPWAEVTADFNGDGMQDLAVVNYYDHNVSVLLNTGASGDGAISFGAPQDFDVGPGPVSMAVADINGDGKPDLVVANSSEHTVSVLINTTQAGDTTPSFLDQQTFIAGDGPDGVVLADVNGDGLPDIVTTVMNDSVVAVLINTTSTGSATASFEGAQTFVVGTSPWGLTAADLNGDGLPDIATVNLYDNTVSVLINSTTTGSATASFEAQQVFSANNQPQSVAAGDINGDGLADLVVVGANDNTVSVLLNQTAASSATASFAAEQDFTAGVGISYSVVIGDVNGDGKADVVVADSAGPTAAVLVNTTAALSSSASFAAEQDFTTGSGWSVAVALADFNADGMPEISLVSAGDNSAMVFLNATAPGDTTLGFVP